MRTGINEMLAAIEGAGLTIDRLNALVDALLELPDITQTAVRNDIVRDLDPAIARAVPEAAAAQAHIKNIVRTCFDFEGGLIGLHECLYFRYKNTIKYGELKTLIARLYDEIGGASGG